MFKAPEKFRITEKHAKSMAFLGPQMLELVTKDSIGNNGYFYLPKEETGKGMYYMVKAVDKDGWNCLAVCIPSEMRAPRWEELFYIKKQFWTEDEFAFMFFHKGPFLAEAGWIHIWQPQDPALVAIPPYDGKIHFKPAGFWKTFFHAIKKALTENRK